MTLEQCHPIYCNPQQLEGSAGWDRHSSSNLHKQQMDGQDEGSGRIYNQRGLTKKGIAIRKTPKGPSCVVSEEEKKNSSSDEARGQTFTPLLRRWRSCPTVDKVLTKARFSTKFIILGLSGLGSLMPTVKDPPKRDPIIGAVCGKNLCASENDNRTRQGQISKRERWRPTYWATNGEPPRGSQLNGRLAPCAWPSPPPGAGRPANLTGGPR